jgi:hypothetical protein
LEYDITKSKPNCTLYTFPTSQQLTERSIIPLNFGEPELANPSYYTSLNIQPQQFGLSDQ